MNSPLFSDLLASIWRKEILGIRMSVSQYKRSANELHGNWNANRWFGSPLSTVQAMVSSQQRLGGFLRIFKYYFPIGTVPGDLWFPTDQNLNCNLSQKCTKEFMGQQCIGEFVQYGFDRKRNQISCTDSPGSCERMVCECDLQFAKGIKKAVQSYDDRNHRFNGFKPDKSKI